MWRRATLLRNRLLIERCGVDKDATYSLIFVGFMNNNTFFFQFRCVCGVTTAQVTNIQETRTKYLGIIGCVWHNYAVSMFSYSSNETVPHLQKSDIETCGAIGLELVTLNKFVYSIDFKICSGKNSLCFMFPLHYHILEWQNEPIGSFWPVK